MTVDEAPVDGDASVEEADVLAAAEEAFTRVMRGAADPVELMPPDLEPADALRWTGDRVTELLAELAELPLNRILGLTPDATGADGGLRSGPAGQDDPAAGGSPPRGEPVVLRGTPGSVVEARIWVHLIGAPPAGNLRFALGGLVGPDGDPCPVVEVLFAPAELAVPTPVGASTLLRLRIPAGAAPGSHHGLVVGRGVAAAVLPITVEVAWPRR